MPSTEGPRLGVESLAVDRWRITNEGAAAVRLLETRFPHGRFRGESLQHDREIAPGESITLSLRVKTSGGPGEIVDNAFLILRLDSWRVLARLRIRFDAGRAAHPEVVVVTSQRAGFSGVEE